ncbi:sensor histidine kinase [Actinomadura terrae]|uniref:sensor histidine kinase n=1 Tax=Actinomadura terrae TaxID=604353 RepID=UPI001FA78659|nr:HAMP domain-containing sensor histidine kinase [Actinomadura terrae]
MWARIFLKQLTLILLTLLVAVLAEGLLVGHWMVTVGIGMCTLGVVGAMAVPLTLWVLAPGPAFDKVIREVKRGDVELLAAHRAPPMFRELFECIQDLATAQQGNAFFVADVAHQLRTELQLLQTRLEGMAGHLDETGERLYARALTDVERLHGTLTEHLELAKLIEASPPIEVDVCDVVSQRVGAWTDVVDRRNIGIRTLLHGKPTILTRHGMLEQLLDILLDNAVRHSPRAGTIIVSVQVGKRDTTLRVVDEGRGMTPEEREHATVRGWRGDQKSGEGRGLGLAIATMLVGSNGGNLTVEEAPGGRGVDARCTFPLIEPDEVTIGPDKAS